MRRASLTLAAAAALASSGLAQEVRFNEIYVDQLGNDVLEFIELIGPPGMPLDGLAVLSVEGDVDDPAPGTVDAVWVLMGETLQTDGYFVLGDASVPGVDLFIGGQNAIENGSQTFYLMSGDPLQLQGLLGTEVRIDPFTTLLPGFGLILDKVGIVDDGALLGDVTYDGAPQFGPAGPGVPPGIYRGFDYPSDWCADFLSANPAALTKQLTPGQQNGACPSSALQLMVETNYPVGEPVSQTLNRIQNKFPHLQLEPSFMEEMAPSDPYGADLLPHTFYAWDLLTRFAYELGLLALPTPVPHPGLDFGQPSRIFRGVLDESVLQPASGFAVWPEGTAVPFSSLPAGGGGGGTPDIGDVLTALGADRLHAQGKTGAGVVIGIVDGGIDTSVLAPLLDTHLGISTDPVTNGWPAASWGTSSTAWFDHGHMTAFDALALAPGAEIYDLRISDSFNPLTPLSTPFETGFLSDAVRAYGWAINQHQTDGTPHILSNSWGIFQDDWAYDYAHDLAHPFSRKVVAALDEGIVVLFAAGNCGPIPHPLANCGTDIGPGQDIWGSNGHPRVITVGAGGADQTLLAYSSRGAAALHPNKPDVIGVAGFDGYYVNVNGGMDEGTSAACATVAGVTALLLEEFPLASHEAIRYGLMMTAKSIGRATTPTGFVKKSLLPAWLVDLLPHWNAAAGAGMAQADKLLWLGIDDLLLPALYVTEVPEGGPRPTGPNTSTQLDQKHRYP